MSDFFRRLRGWMYRRYPSLHPYLHQKKMTGYARRWGLEKNGFTKQDFFAIYQRRILAGVQPGIFFELASGDGRVGSIGCWQERIGKKWKMMAWEHRPAVAASFARNCPLTPLHQGRLTHWTDCERKLDPVGIISRGARESSGVCREIQSGRIRPTVVGIWNPTRRPVWFRRLKKRGYRLEIVYERMEIYRWGGK